MRPSNTNLPITAKDAFQFPDILIPETHPADQRIPADVLAALWWDDRVQEGKWQGFGYLQMAMMRHGVLCILCAGMPGWDFAVHGLVASTTASGTHIKARSISGKPWETLLPISLEALAAWLAKFAAATHVDEMVRRLQRQSLADLARWSATQDEADCDFTHKAASC